MNRIVLWLWCLGVAAALLADLGVPHAEQVALALFAVLMAVCLWQVVILPLVRRFRR